MDRAPRDRRLRRAWLRRRPELGADVATAKPPNTVGAGVCHLAGASGVGEVRGKGEERRCSPDTKLGVGRPRLRTMDWMRRRRRAASNSVSAEGTKAELRRMKSSVGPALSFARERPPAGGGRQWSARRPTRTRSGEDSIWLTVPRLGARCTNWVGHPRPTGKWRGQSPAPRRRPAEGCARHNPPGGERRERARRIVQRRWSPRSILPLAAIFANKPTWDITQALSSSGRIRFFDPYWRRPLAPNATRRQRR